MNKQEMKEFFINLTGNLVVVENGDILYKKSRENPKK